MAESDPIVIGDEDTQGEDEYHASIRTDFLDFVPLFQDALVKVQHNQREGLEVLGPFFTEIERRLSGINQQAIVSAGSCYPLTVLGFCKCLHPRRWLDETFISCYANLLRSMFPAMAIISGLFVEMLFRFEHCRQELPKEAESRESWDNVLLVIVRQGHFSLVHIQAAQSTLHYFDSMFTLPEDLKSLLPEWLTLYGRSKCQFESWPRHEDWIWHVVQVPRQANSDDCGVFCCVFMRMALGAPSLLSSATETVNFANMLPIRRLLCLEVACGTLLL